MQDATTSEFIMKIKYLAKGFKNLHIEVIELSDAEDFTNELRKSFSLDECLFIQVNKTEVMKDIIMHTELPNPYIEGIVHIGKNRINSNIRKLYKNSILFEIPVNYLYRYQTLNSIVSFLKHLMK